MSELTFETVLLIEKNHVDKEDAEAGFFEMPFENGYEYYLPEQSDALMNSLNDGTSVIVTEGKNGETLVHYKVFASIPLLENTFIVVTYVCDERTKEMKRTTDGCQIKDGRAVYYSTTQLSEAAFQWVRHLDFHIQSLLQEEPVFRLRFLTGEISFKK